MGAGIRPKGAFPYAALRYSLCWKDVPCYGKPTTCPDITLCEKCVHFVGCRDKHDEQQEGAMTRSQRNITPGKGDISTWLDCPVAHMIGYPYPNDILGCFHVHGVVSSCHERRDCGLCYRGYAR